MRRWIHQTEVYFESFAWWVIRWRWWVIVANLVLLVGLLGSLNRLTVDTSTEGFFEREDASLQAYNAFKEQFGNDSSALLMIEAADPFSLKALETLKELHQTLEAELPNLDEVQSLVNVTATRGEGDQLVVQELMDPFPQTEEELQVFWNRALSNPFYENNLVSPDGHLLLVIARPVAWVAPAPPDASSDDLLAFDSSAGTGGSLDLGGFDDPAEPDSADASEPPTDSAAQTPRLLTQEEKVDFTRAVAQVMERFQSDDFRIYEGGSLVMERVILEEMMSNIPRFTVISMTLIVSLLFLVFRRLVGIVLPLLMVVLSLAGTIGAMAWMQAPVTIVSQILPSFMLAVGVGYSVHLLTLFFQHYDRHTSLEQSLVNAMGHSGIAILVTSLTTAGGLLSFSGAPMEPVAQMGRFGAFGVLLSVVLTLTLLPALVSLLPLQPRPRPQHEEETLSEKLLAGIGEFSVRHARWVLTFFAATVAGALLLSLDLRFSHDPVAWLPEDSPARIASATINEEMRGAVIAELVVQPPQSVKAPETMSALERFNREAEQLEVGPVYVGKSTSIADTLKQIHQALNDNQADFYAIPTSANLISQELLLFENAGSDDLERLVDPEYTTARVTLKMPWTDANAYVPMLDAVEALAAKIFGSDAKVLLTGFLTLMSHTIQLLMESMVESYLIASGVITLMMMLVLGSVRLGLWSMIPNLLPIVLGLGLMQLLDLPLDAMSILVGSIALGLAVDDTIHFLHNFRRFHDQTGDVMQAVHQTLTTTGRAMLFTTVVLASGFYTYIISDMSNLFSFGLITGTALLFALLADLMVAPALMAVLERNRSSSTAP